VLKFKSSSRKKPILITTGRKVARAFGLNMAAVVAVSYGGAASEVRNEREEKDRVDLML